MPSRVMNQNWVFGKGAALTVTGANPTALSGSFPINTREGCASISDATGQLVLSTDGVTAWDHPSGTPQVTGLTGHSSSTQSALVVPDPGDPNQYYEFTVAGYTSGTAFHHLDGVRVRATGGTWQTTPLFPNIMPMPPTNNLSPTEKLAGVGSSNCVDFFVITIVTTGPPNAQNGPGSFRVLRVGPGNVQHTGDWPINVDVYDLGYLRVNRSGSRLAFANADKHELWVFNFNNFSGAVDIASPVHIQVPQIPGVPNHPRIPYGVEFSPSGDLLYYSVIGSGNTGTNPDNNGYIFRVQLGTTTTPASTLIQTYPNPTAGVGPDYAIGALQLGNDDRIYIAKDQEASLGAIINPDAVSPTVNMNFFTLAPGATCQLGLPNFVTSLCDCHCAPGCFGFARRIIGRMRPWRRAHMANR